MFLPAVQRTVLTNGAGRFTDHYALRETGKWVIAVNGGGDGNASRPGRSRLEERCTRRQRI